MGKEPQPTGDVAPSEQDFSVRNDAGDCPQAHRLREQVEQWVETDPSLVPVAPSSLLVEPSVLDPAEVRALLADLDALLAGAGAGAGLGTRVGRVARVPLFGLADSLFGAAEATPGDSAGHSAVAATSATPSGTDYDALPGAA